MRRAGKHRPPRHRLPRLRDRPLKPIVWNRYQEIVPPGPQRHIERIAEFRGLHDSVTPFRRRGAAGLAPRLRDIEAIRTVWNRYRGRCATGGTGACVSCPAAPTVPAVSAMSVCCDLLYVYPIMEHWSWFAKTLVEDKAISYNTPIVMVTVCDWHATSDTSDARISWDYVSHHAPDTHRIVRYRAATRR